MHPDGVRMIGAEGRRVKTNWHPIESVQEGMVSQTLANEDAAIDRMTGLG
jgi:hypothetical protein